MAPNIELILGEIRNLVAVIVCFLVIVSALKFAAFLVSLCRLCKDIDYTQRSNLTTTTVESEDTGEVPVTIPRSYFETIEEEDRFENQSSTNDIPLMEFPQKEIQGQCVTACLTGVIRQTVTAIATSTAERQHQVELASRRHVVEAEV